MPFFQYKITVQTIHDDGKKLNQQIYLGTTGKNNEGIETNNPVIMVAKAGV